MSPFSAPCVEFNSSPPSAMFAQLVPLLKPTLPSGSPSKPLSTSADSVTGTCDPHGLPVIGTVRNSSRSYLKKSRDSTRPKSSMPASSGLKAIPKESRSKSPSKRKSTTIPKWNKPLSLNSPNSTCNATTAKSNSLLTHGAQWSKCVNMQNTRKHFTWLNSWS